MKNWKKNAILTSILVFVCAGIYLNWSYTQDGSTVDLVDTLNENKILDDSTLVMKQTDLSVQSAAEDLTQSSGSMTDYFAAVRLSRQQSRDSAVTLLQEAMAYGEESESGAETSAKLENIVNTALCEAQIESLVIAKGYADCVAYMSDDGISVAVAAPEEGLKETDIALISDIIMTQADYELADIRIIEVK